MKTEASSLAHVYVPVVLDSPGAIDLFIDTANRNAKVFFSDSTQRALSVLFSGTIKNAIHLCCAYVMMFIQD